MYKDLNVISTLLFSVNLYHDASLSIELLNQIFNYCFKYFKKLSKILIISMVFRSPQTLLFRRYNQISVTTSKFNEKGYYMKFFSYKILTNINYLSVKNLSYINY